MVVVRPVEPSVYERRRRPQNTGKARAAHDAVCRPVFLEQGEGAVVQPTVIPELNADAEPFRDMLKEVGEPHLIDRCRRWKLDQEHPALGAEERHAVPDAPATVPARRAV